MKILSFDQIWEITRWTAWHNRPDINDGVERICEAQARLTLQEVGEWFRRNGKMIIDSAYILCPADIDKFERGEMPKEEK